MSQSFTAVGRTVPDQRSLVAALAAAMLVFGFCGSADAQTSPRYERRIYAGLGVTEISDVVELGAVTARLGARLSSYLALEGEASVGVLGTEVEGAIEGDAESTSFALSASLDHSLAAYLVGLYPAAPDVDLFVRAGLGRARVEVEGSAGDAQIDGFGEGSFYAVGLGGQYALDASNGVRLEYTRLRLKGLGYDVGTFGLSYVRRF